MPAFGLTLPVFHCFFFYPPAPQTLSKLLELYLKLRELGHPDYTISKRREFSIKCSKFKMDVDILVQDMHTEVTKWKEDVSNLRTEYEWLLYFSVPKILLLYDLITSPNGAEKIIQEVSFLTDSKQHLEGVNMVERIEVYFFDN